MRHCPPTLQPTRAAGALAGPRAGGDAPRQKVTSFRHKVLLHGGTELRKDRALCQAPLTPWPGLVENPFSVKNQSKNLSLLPTSSERTNNAPALSVPFPCWTNPSPQVVQTFLAAPFLGAEGCTGITVTPLSEAAQSPQPEASSCLELSFKNQNQHHDSASVLPSLGSSAAPHSRPLSLCAPSLPPSNAPADSPAPSQEHKRCQQGGSCGQTASTVPSHSL